MAKQVIRSGKLHKYNRRSTTCASSQGRLLEWIEKCASIEYRHSNGCENNQRNKYTDSMAKQALHHRIEPTHPRGWRRRSEGISHKPPSILGILHGLSYVEYPPRASNQGGQPGGFELRRHARDARML